MYVNPNPLRDPQDAPPAAWGDCGHEIWPGECRFRWESRWLCPDCFRAAVRRALEEDPAQVALEMQLDVERRQPAGPAGR